MQDATISKEQPEPLYQRGKYPSVIDTDDLVFEMGIQLVGNLNKEKLLDNLVKRAGMFEKAAVEANTGKVEAEKKLAPLTESNRLYVINNQKLDAELVKVRRELESAKQDYIATKNELEIAKVTHLTSVKQHEEKDIELVKVRKELETTKQLCESLKKEIETAKATHQAFVKNYEDKIVALQIAQAKELADLAAVKDEEIAGLKKRKAPKKKEK